MSKNRIKLWKKIMHTFGRSLTRSARMSHSFPNNVRSFYSIHSPVPCCCCCCFIFDLVVCGCTFVCLYCAVYTGEVHIFCSCFFMKWVIFVIYQCCCWLAFAFVRPRTPHCPSIVQHQPLEVMYPNNNSIIIIIAHTHCWQMQLSAHFHFPTQSLSLALHFLNALHGAAATK